MNHENITNITRITKVLLVFNVIVFNYQGANSADGALSASITPSESQVIKIDGQVNFGCSPSGGCEPYSYSWSFPGASGSPPSTVRNPGNVAFGSSAAGTNNIVSVTITDANEETYTASVEVGIPKFESTEDIWFFNDGKGDDTYAVERDLSVKGVPSDTTLTWRIVGQDNAIKFTNNQQQIVGTDTTRKITSIGWSSTENNIILELDYQGTNVATSESFTVRAPTTTTESVGPATGVRFPESDWGYMRAFTYTLTDKFGKQLEGLNIFEVFDNPTTWEKIYEDCNWPDKTNYGPNWELNGSSQFVDTFGWSSPLNQGYIPPTVEPGTPGASEQVIGNNQKYKAGGEGTQGFNATGFVVFEDNIILCRGTAHR